MNTKYSKLKSIRFSIAFLMLSLSSVYGQFPNASEVLLEGRTELANSHFADINMDGFDDIVGTNVNDIIWYPNDGSGGFNEKIHIFGMNKYVKELIISDIDHDGLNDILAVYLSPNPNTFRIFLLKQIVNNSFVLVNDILANVNTQSNSNKFTYHFEDINNDNESDILVTGSQGTLILTNTGNFTFTETLLAESMETLELADVNNDGWKDLILVDDYSFFVKFNDGTGGFGPSGVSYTPVSMPGINYYSNCVVVDYDNDGDIDVIQGFHELGKIVAFANDGNGVFTEFSTLGNISGEIQDLELRDMNQDGIMDLIYRYGNNFVQRLGNGVFFDPPTSVVSINFQNWNITYDFSNNLGNGQDDFLFYNNLDNEVRFNQLFSGLSPNTYVLNSNFDSTYFDYYSFSIYTDLNQDGFVDIVHHPYVYMNNGNSDFVVSIDSLLFSAGQETDDINNDGILDLIGNTTNNYSYWLGDGIGGFENQTIVGSDINIKGVLYHDYNNDGLKDFIYHTHVILSKPKLKVSINQGNGTYAPPLEPISAWLNSNLGGFYPINNLKFVSQNNQPENVDYVFTVNNQVYVKFNSVATPNLLMTFTGIGFKGIRIGDIDNDGLVDISITQNTDFKWYKNMGNYTFELQTILNGNFEFVLQKDFDFDGDLDYFFESDTTIYLYENYGYGEFSDLIPLSHAAESVNNGTLGISLVDIDSDGDLDLIFGANPPENVPYIDADLLVLKSNLSSEFLISGLSYWDKNNNNLHDSNESVISLQSIIMDTIYVDYTNNNGEFMFAAQGGNHYLECMLPENWSLSSGLPNLTVNVSETLPIIDSIKFGFVADTLIIHSIPDITGAYPRCNDTINYWLSIKNNGTTFVSGVLELVLDDSLTYINSLVSPDSISGNHIYWSYDSILPFSKSTFSIFVSTPDFQSQGDLIVSNLINHIHDTLGIEIESNSEILSQTIVCAYDPNDKLVDPKGIGPEGYVANDLTMEYLVRFQNTGNDTALNVIVKDIIHSNLDITTFEIISSSHPLSFNILTGRNLSFEFNNILLPDSATNFIGSQGFVKYKIDMMLGLVPGDKIQNRANIYFDYNPPIITNTTLNTIFSCDSMPVFNSFDQVICDGDEVLYEFEENIFVENITWIQNQDTLSTSSQLIYTASLPSEEISLTIQNPFCINETIWLPNISENLSILNQNDSIIICEGDSVSLISNYIDGNNLWYSNQILLSSADSVLAINSGLYVLNSLNENCSISDSIFVQVIELPSPIIEIINGNTLQSSSEYSSYTWVDCLNNMTAIENENDQIFEALNDGVYAVSVTNTDGCANVSECISLNFSKLNENINSSVKFVPNPADDFFVIEGQENIDKIEILDSYGSIVGSYSSSIYMDISNLASGLYYVKIAINNTIITQKLVIRH